MQKQKTEKKEKKKKTKSVSIGGFSLVMDIPLDRGLDDLDRKLGPLDGEGKRRIG